MKRITAGFALAALAIAACGVDSGGIDLPDDGDTPILQVKSEGGFAPVEFILGQGPTYTLLANGRLISEGPVIAIHPGPLVPNYQVATINDDQMRSVLDMVSKIGLLEMIDEFDDTNTRTVADATTEVVTYWDENGAHRYSVYALGLVASDAVRPETTSFQELLVLLDQLATQTSTAYVADQVQYVVGPGWNDPDFTEIQDWPLSNSDFGGWKTLPNGWRCQVQSGPVPSVFTQANSATLWSDPEGGEPLKVLVRPLLPGEELCLGN